jgi:uncharacterized lipoprotein YddW (UPF0748 family)
VVVPFGVFRDGMGIFTVKLNHGVKSRPPTCVISAARINNYTSITKHFFPSCYVRFGRQWVESEETMGR